MSSVAVITCTGNRPEAFEEARRYVERQTRRPDQWIISDDGSESAPPSKSDQWAGVELIRRPPGISPFATLEAALARVTADCVVIMDDSTWYAPNHVASMAAGLETADFYGHPIEGAYNVRHGMFRIYRPSRWSAPFAATGFRSSWIPIVRRSIRTATDSGDIGPRLWKDAPGIRATSPRSTAFAIRGMPGRPRHADGERPQYRPDLWTKDPELGMLRAWIGTDDAARYVAHHWGVPA